MTLLDRSIAYLNELSSGIVGKLSTSLIILLVGFVLGRLAGAVVMIIIATALGIKDFIPNMIAGIFIYRQGIIKENQRMIIKNVEGKVKKISIIETELETKNGDIILVPNSLIIKSTVIVKKGKNEK